MNDYETLGEIYNESHEKPDKKYSILPTILNIAVSHKNPKIVLDLGCGDGFFTFPLARMFPESIVVGFDNSRSQINAADKKKGKSHIENIEFSIKDIFKEELPDANLIIAPFLLNYLSNEKELLKILKKLRASLLPSGKIIFVFDNPRGFDNSRFGAKKEIISNKIKLTLYKNKKEKICNLESYFYSPKTIKKLLNQAGFSKNSTHKPIISDEGIRTLGKRFWKGFIDQSELLYISAENN